jgi:hypothetical protein
LLFEQLFEMPPCGGIAMPCHGLFCLSMSTIDYESHHPKPQPHRWPHSLSVATVCASIVFLSVVICLCINKTEPAGFLDPVDLARAGLIVIGDWIAGFIGICASIAAMRNAFWRKTALVLLLVVAALAAGGSWLDITTLPVRGGGTPGGI